MTVDVEALRDRAVTDHVDALIWGRYPGDDAHYGVEAMIQEGDRAGVPFTFFLDFAERYTYGGEIDRVANTIARSGHDLQLHIHAEMLPEDFWSRRGLTRPEGRRYNYPAPHCRVVMETLIADMTTVTQRAPVAYRAGAFQINRAWMDEAARCGIKVSSNHCYASWVNQKREPVAGPEEGVFRWENGLYELPVTQIRSEGKWRTLAMPMNLPSDPGFTSTLQVLAEDVDGPPVVFLLHSWSLLAYARKGKTFAGGAPGKVRRLSRMLRQVAELFEPISSVEFAHRAASGRYGDTHVRAYPGYLSPQG